VRPFTLALLAASLAAPAAAQGPGGPGGPAPLPDHWLTIDSLTQILGLSAEQRTKVSEPYNALNGVLKQAADKRAAMRGTMRRRGADEMTPAEREAMRARMDSVRAEFAPLQAEVDEWHAAIRNALTPEQQAKFDALPKPRVLPEMMRRRG
jgi:Spy/CpxP family protein refolding chaperone